MIRYIFLLSTIFFSFSHKNYGIDTIPPTGKLINPTHLTVITGNTIKLSVEAKDEESGIKEVRFFTFYTEYSILDSENRYGWNKIMIGKVRQSPYEIAWDCSGIPDQDIYSLSLWCDIEDNAGNITKNIGRDKWVVIDRKQEIRQTHFLCKKLKKQIVFDGRLNDWKDQDSIFFKNGDNTIICYSGWNKKNLFLGVYVADQFLYSPKGEGREIWEGDAFEIYFDTKNDRASIPGKDDFHLIVSATGEYSFFVKDFNTFKSSSPDCIKHLKIKTRGTINDNTDIDKGFIAEIAIPWKCMNLNPKNKLKFGFDILNSDQESKNGYTTVFSWAGNEANTNNNPSEWGTVTLEQNIIFRANSFITIIISFVLVIFVIFYFINSKKARGHSTIKAYTKQEQIVNKAIIYLEENYKDTTLNREKVALYLNISSVYLGEIFKKNANKSLPEYLNEIRISHGKELLRNSEMKIEEISYEIGFNSLSYFVRVFKKYEGLTPTDFRIK